MRELLIALIAFGALIYVSEQNLNMEELIFGKSRSQAGHSSMQVEGGTNSSVSGLRNHSVISPGQKVPIKHSYHVVSFVTGNRRIRSEDIDATYITHINYAFVDLVEGEVKSYLSYDKENLAELCKLREQYPHLRILVSIGGWYRSGGFSDAALTDVNRDKFARSAIAFMKRHRLDGIDIDWEYPGSAGAGNTYRKSDKRNFTLMLKVLREHLDRERQLDGRLEDDPYLLTIAGGVGDSYLGNIEMDRIHRIVDFINLMCYDFSGKWSRRTAHHSNLYASQSSGGSRIDVTESVRQYVKAGVPVSKINLGVAFFGRGWHNVQLDNQGLHQKTGDFAGNFAFHTLQEDYFKRKDFEQHWDSLAKAPYLWSPVSRTFITYDDTASLRHKVDFIHAQELAGVMFWEYYKDTTQTLITALHTRFNELAENGGMNKLQLADRKRLVK